MVIPSCDQRRPRWRAQRGCMKHVIAKTTVCESLKIRRLDWPAKNRRRAETNVIGQDKQDVRRTLQCLDTLGEIRCRFLSCSGNLARKWLFRFWKDFLRLCR